MELPEIPDEPVIVVKRKGLFSACCAAPVPQSVVDEAKRRK